MFLIDGEIEWEPYVVEMDSNRIYGERAIRVNATTVLDTRNPPGIKYSTKQKCGPIYGSLQYWDKPKCERARPFLFFPCTHNLDIPSPA